MKIAERIDTEYERRRQAMLQSDHEPASADYLIEHDHNGGLYLASVMQTASRWTRDPSRALAFRSEHAALMVVSAVLDGKGRAVSARLAVLRDEVPCL